MPGLPHYLWLWRRKGLIKALGGKSDIYFNLVATPDAVAGLEAAVRRALPDATLGARNVLHAAGLTTQRPGVLHLLIRPGAPTYAIDSVEFTRRGAQFWDTVDGMRARSPGGGEELPRLSIAAALAESALDAGGLDPDDIDFEEVSASEVRKLRRLLEKLAVAGLTGNDDANLLYRKGRGHTIGSRHG